MFDPALRESLDGNSRLSRLGRAAIIAALLFHVGVIGGVLFRWPALFGAKPPPAPIAVTLVQEPAPPPPPPAPPKPAVKPPPPPPMKDRVSGADNETTAPKEAEQKPEETAPPPPTVEPSALPSPTAVPVPKPVPNPAKEAKPPKPKVAEREASPKPKRGEVNRAEGETEQSGDPYLNRIWAMIERRRTYPANAVGSLGLPLEGTAVFLIEIGADGTLLNVQLQRSAGAAILDHTAAQMIKSAAPFPPLPQGYYSGGSTVLQATIHIFPGAG